ncbi:MAG: PAS domain-containing protein [Myxococcales bacterium]|nr:PAS domain-containing protein [Myxococcales bacterium]
MNDARPNPPPWWVTGAFDVETHAPQPAEDSAVERIKWTTLARVALITAVLLFGVALDLGIGPHRAAQVPETLLYQWAAAAYVLSFLALLAAHLFRTNSAVVPKIAYASVAIDALIALALVYMTDGLQSVFQFAMPLAVLNSSVVLARSGAVTAATLVTVGIVAMGCQEMGYFDLPPWRVAFLSALPPRTPLTGFEALTDLLVQGAAAYATAFLSSHLVVELDNARRRTLQQRRELATLRVRYDDVVSSLPDGLLTLGPSGTVTSANPAALAILCATLTEVVGRGLMQVLPELADALLDPPGEWEITRSQASFVGDPQQTQEVQRTRTDGTAQVLACRVAALRDQGGQWGRVVVFRDLTEVRQREAAHQSRERLAVIGSMAAAVAHEIRNPLASIFGAVQLLESMDGVGASDRKLMQIVQRETSQLNIWIGEFLDFARPRPLQSGSCDLYEIINETMQACRNDPRVVSAGTEIAWQQAGAELEREEFGQPSAPLVADAVLLRQSVWNLLLNSCQAVLEGDQRKIEVGVRRDGEMWLMWVEDSGPGIDDVQLGRVFEPFFTTKGEGTGMGLALVERNVQAHRGTVQAMHSSSLGGARFEVRLPVRPLSDGFGDSGRRASRSQMAAPPKMTPSV